MNRAMITVAALVACVELASAQNLDRSVEVSNDFRGKVASSDKQSVQMTVPDSLGVFDLKFDYSVFESPYRSRYTFVPYMVKFLPSGSSYDGNSIYLDAGCGWPLAPTFTAVYAPKPKGTFRYCVSTVFDGYSGDFRSFSAPEAGVSEFFFKGADLQEKVGFAAQNRFAGSLLTMSGDFRYIGTGDNSCVSDNYLGADVRLGMRSISARSLEYDVNLEWNYGRENNAAVQFTENLVRSNGFFRPSFTLKGMRFAALYELGNLSHGGDLGVSSAFFSLTPMAIFNLTDAARLDAGLSVSACGGLRVYPHVKLQWPLLKNNLKLYASVTGSDRPCDYASLKMVNHFLSSACASDYDFCSRTSSFEAMAGADGRVGSYIQYEASAGWKWSGGAPMYGTDAAGSTILRFCSYGTVYADAHVAFDMGPVSLDGKCVYRHSDLNEDSVFGIPAFEAGLAVRYRYRSRIFAELSADFLSRRDITVEGRQMYAPSYCNLCFKAEYRLSRTLAVWAKGLNLLDQFVGPVPTYARRGVDVTAGISCTLR